MLYNQLAALRSWASFVPFLHRIVQGENEFVRCSIHIVLLNTSDTPASSPEDDLNCSSLMVLLLRA
jgi:hypothetical protein